MIFIFIKNRACEKTKLPLNALNPRFHSAVRAAECDSRIEPENETDLKYLIPRFHSAVSFRGQAADPFRGQAADHNRRTQPEIINASGVKRRFQIRGQAADLTAESDQRPLVQNGGFIPRPGRGS